jgi:hypothetical protein
MLNPKILLIAAIAIMIGILGVIFMMTSTNDASIEGSDQKLPNQVEPITIKLEEVSILQVSTRAVILEIQFKLDNPNPRSVIAQLLQYSLYVSDGSEEFKVASGQIGSRPEGMVDGSNYYTLLSNNSVVLKDKITLESPGNNPELMTLFEGSNQIWRAEGDVVFNLSSITSGQENEIHFESILK